MRVLLSGGGSGGHIYPALAIAQGLKKVDPSADILYVGTNHGLERDLVPRQKIAFRTIHARGLLVPGIWGKIGGVLSAVRGLPDAFVIIRAFKPNVVVGTGGYVSGPVGLAAGILKVPLVIQEQNAWPGLTNRSLAKRAGAVFVPFEEAIKHFPPNTPVMIAGNPVRSPGDRISREEARRRLGLDEGLRLLMTTGGSQGADAVNRLMMKLLDAILQDEGIGLIWATGKRYYDSVSEKIRARFGGSLDERRIQVLDYFYDIQTVYQAADLFVGRAGAMSLTDCEAFGVPAVLIPSPNVSEDHQTRNAQAIAKRGAGLLINEEDLSRRGPEVIALLKDEERLGQMGKRISQLFDGDALERITETIWKIGGGRA